jgi:hypothetical protein
MVIFGHLTLTFVYLDEHTWLVVGVSGESILLFGWDGGVARTKHSHETASGLDALWERGNIYKEKVLNLLWALTRENGSLNGSSIGDGLIRVDGSVELLSVEKFRKHLLYFGNTSWTSDKDDFVNLTLRNVCVL